MTDDAQVSHDKAISIAEAFDHPAVTIDAYCYAGLFPAFLAGNFEALQTYANRCLSSQRQAVGLEAKLMPKPFATNLDVSN